MRQPGPNAESAAGAQPIAIVGMGCRFPDADDPAGLLDLVLTERRAFRRLPPRRLDLTDYYSADRATPDATYCARAAVLEGWQFDLKAFGVPDEVYRAADPVQWLALETAARALAAAGFAQGQGLARSRTGVIIGNTLTGDASRAAALRLRWPYVRRVFAEALAAGDIPRDRAMPVLRHAAARYLAPFPATTDETLTGATAAGIAARICGYFGFRGGGYAVDGAQASSLVAVASACTALTAGDLDVAVAGGVDLSLDPLELVGLAKAGALARGEMRVYDENPTGFLPGEGCGMVVLMRSADARKAGLPVYAEIAGWGTSSAGKASMTAPDANSQLLALHRAYQRARIAPADVQLIEGHGAGTAAADSTELSALAELRADARHVAALGSIKANIGNTKAAAGAAGLIKTVLAMSTGIIPPATGFSRPHPLLRGGEAALRLPRAPESWPDGPRIAGVSAMGPGVGVHLVLRSERARGRHERKQPVSPQVPRTDAGPAAAVEGAARRDSGSPRSTAYLLHAPDRNALAAILARIAHVAPWLSDAELGDLACQLARDAANQGPVRLAIVATRQEQLARLASQAAAMLSGLADGLLAQRPGIFAADGADGRVTLLLSDAGDREARPDGGADTAGEPHPAEPEGPADQPDDLLRQLSALRWLDLLGIRATAAVGYGRGEFVGLIWAGCLTEADAVAFAAKHTEILNATSAADSRGASDAAARESGPDDRREQLRDLVRHLKVASPHRRLISAVLAREVTSAEDIADLLCAELDCPAGLAPAVQTGALGASLLLETGPGQVLAGAASVLSEVPAISLGAGGGVDAARAAAALFAAGALEHPSRLFAGRPSRPIDIWRERTFITNPCQAGPPAALPAAPAADLPAAPLAQAAATARRAAAAERAAAAKRTPAAPAPETTAALTPAPAPETAAGPAPEPTRAPAAQPAARPAPVPAAGPAPEPTLAPAPQPAARPAPVPAAGPAPEPTLAPAPQPTAGPAPEPAAGPAPGTQAVAGVGSWARLFTEELRPVDNAIPADDDGPWRVRAAVAESFGPLVHELFSDDPGADRALAIVGDPASPHSCAVALAAARDAISSGRLVMITHSPGFTGFCASLHAEHPELGITVLRVPESAEGLRAARRFAAAEPGQFRELVIDTAARPHEAVMVPAEIPAATEFPLGSDDVVLVSRGSGGAGLALAQVLACCGAPIAVIGQDGPGETAEVEAGLERLRSAGVRMAIEAVDVANPADLRGALERIERRLGPVTAIAYAVGTDGPRPFAEVTEEELRAHVSAATASLDYLVSAITTQQLRLIVTFGSIVGRYGLAGESLLALASGSLAERAERMSDGIPGCRALHVDWPAWSGSGLGQRDSLADELARAGAMAIPVREGARLLLKTLATPDLPARVAIHGRVGVPGPAEVAAALPAAQLPVGRFLEDVRVHYQGVELVCDARLTLRTDPYLSDYQVDGLPVLPPTMALEAMAEAAAALAGQPLRRLTGVSMEAPVVIPAGADGQALIRICALRDGASVMAVLRCEESGFGIDHFRATFRVAEDTVDAAAPSLAGLPELDEMPASHDGIVDGTELYGPTFFQTGRFGRAALLPEVTARSCRALVRGGDAERWFGDPDGLADSGLILGSPGLNDATWHVLQACVPHRRLLPAGCEAVTFSGREADGAVEIRAVEVVGASAAGTGRAAAEAATPTAVPPTTEQPATMPPATVQPATVPPATVPPATVPPATEPPATEPPATEPPATEPPATEQLTTVQPAVPAAKGPLRRSVPRPRSAARAMPQPPAVAVPPQGDQARASLASARAAEYVWDVEAVDAAGQSLVTWRGLRLADAGPLPRTTPWPPSLLSAYLERSAVALGLNPELRVTVRCGQPDDAGTAPAAAEAAAADASTADASTADASMAESPTTASAATAAVPQPSPPPDLQPSVSWTHAALGSGRLEGFVLSVRAPEATACSWQVAVPVPEGGRDLGPALADIEDQLRIRPGEPPAVVSARLKAVASCLSRAGAPAASSVVADTAADPDWLLLRVAGATLVCVVVEISGVSDPVAIAIMTGVASESSERGRRSRRQSMTRS